MLVYVDTSVFGEAFDARFEQHSTAFFDRARAGAFDVVVSALVLDEFERAAAQVKELFTELEPLLVRVDVDEAAYNL